MHVKELKGVEEFLLKVEEAKKFERKQVREGHLSSFNTIIQRLHARPDDKKANIWLKQAEYDMEALDVLLCSGLTQLSGHVCFMANQVAEKALRAGMYALVGLQPYDLITHDLVGFAKKIEANSDADGVTDAASSLNHYLCTRYPNKCVPSHSIPADHYTKTHARQAKSNAEKLLKAIRPLVHVEEAIDNDNMILL